MSVFKYSFVYVLIRVIALKLHDQGQVHEHCGGKEKESEESEI